MPRPKKPDQDGREVKKRSRNGCWPCKARKVKCGEEKPACVNCQRQGEACDYSIRLNWDGRTKKKDDGKPGSQMIAFDGPATLSRQDSDGSTYNGFTPGSHTTQLSPRQNEYIPQRSTSPYPPPLMQSNPASPYPPQMQSQPLPPITDFTNNIHMPAPDFEHPSLPMPPILRNPSWGDPPNTGNFQSLAPAPPLRPQNSMGAYPSPAESFASPNNGSILFNNGYSMVMPPPLPTSNPMQQQDAARSPFNPAKRMRLSPRNESLGRNPNLVHRSSSYGPGDLDDVSRPTYNPLTPTFLPAYLSNPLTPAASSTSHISQDNDDRRISVSSLLSGSPEPPDMRDMDEFRPMVQVDPPAEEQYVPVPRRGSLHQRMISYSETETYGQDRGYPDLDIPRNNDTIAITGASPSEHSDFDSWLSDFEPMPEFGFGLEKKETVFAKGGYYASPVTIKIPRKLEPLPQTLSDNPMNLLYFHHFLNYTARILVPHDCPENPFKTILPQMAVENPNLLNLMLAYSASHRARLLSHPEPANRIALWVRDVFPSLRQSLDNISNTEVSNANLATAIMLTSLEIISPASFGVSIPWQDHLSTARSIIRQRGGPHSVSRKDPVMYFLTRWLAYLDVLGSLSGRWNEEPLFAGNYWSSSHDDGTSAKELSLTDEDVDDDDDDDDYTIDCLLGFTTRCVSILAQIALLARQCDGQRIGANDGQVDPFWRPSETILKQAKRLRNDLEHARDHEQKQCSHHSPVLSKAELCTWGATSAPVDMSDLEAEESLATNSAFHWAGLVHLLRRVHNLPKSDPEVQNAVHEIVKVLGRIREGGSAEACLLFPMFTAGVEAESEVDRAAVLSRIQGAEGLGMCQVSRARRIMEEVWRTGLSWESLVTGEFFG